MSCTKLYAWTDSQVLNAFQCYGNVKFVPIPTSRVNCCFGRLWEGFNFTETEFIYSFAASKFQHLIDFKSL
jgi:hypothetical protein